VFALPTLTYGNETWILAKRSVRSIESAELKFLRYVKRCTRPDKISNHDVRSELGTYKNEKMQTNETNWLRDVEITEDYIVPKFILD
jgi:hypothetical protein